MIRLFAIFLTTLFTACTTSKQATVIGYDNGRSILVTSDTISYGTKSKPMIGEKYKVKFCGNKVTAIKKSK